MSKRKSPRTAPDHSPPYRIEKISLNGLISDHARDKNDNERTSMVFSGGKRSNSAWMKASSLSRMSALYALAETMQTVISYTLFGMGRLLTRIEQRKAAFGHIKRIRLLRINEWEMRTKRFEENGK